MRTRLLVVFLIAVFFSLGVASALSCSITTSCNSANKVIALSSTTNAHGEVYNAGNYNYYVCCDVPVGHTCDGGNKVIGLSSTTNAHGEIASLDNYATDVCFEGHSCTARTTCNADETAIMSLSSTTNAHIGGANDYAQKICCKAGTGGPYAFWSNDEFNEISEKNFVILGTSGVYLMLNNSGLDSCDGCVSFEIKEDDSPYLDDNIRQIWGDVWPDGKVSAFWTITQEDISNSIHPLQNDFENDGVYEFYFEVEGEESDILEVTVMENECKLYSASWGASQAVGGQEVQLYVQGNSHCDGFEISFEVKEKDTGTDDDVRQNPANAIFDGSSAVGTWIAEWPDTGEEEEVPTYYFNAELVEDPSEDIKSSDPLLSVFNSEACIGIEKCMNYLTENECNSDMCGVGTGSVEANNPDVTCGTTYNDLTGCDETTDCGCEWDESESICGPIYEEISGCEGGLVSSIGLCTYNENSQDNCDDGILTYSWTAQWNWGGLNSFIDNPDPEGEDYVLDGGTWRYNPQDSTGKRKSEKCVGGENSVSCPAQIQLPFFSEYTAIATILVVVLIYILMNKCKKKKSKKK